VRAVTLTASAARALIASTAPSPALSKTLPAKHHVSLRRERSEIRRDGAVQDGGGNLHERRQEKGPGRQPNIASWYRRMRDGPYDGPVRATNQPIYFRFYDSELASPRNCVGFRLVIYMMM
jgi:hypothetical protein